MGCKMKNLSTAFYRSVSICCILFTALSSSMFCSISDAVKKTKSDRNTSRIIPGVPEDTKAARIYEDGRMEILNINPDNSWIHSGKTQNAVSPDGRYIAYSKDHNSFWLFDADTGEDINVHPKQNDYGSFTPEGWSVNNDKLMYKLDKNSKASYFIYSLKDRTGAEIDLPGKFVTWAADDEMVISSEDSLIVKGKETRKLPVTDKNFDFYQITRSPDGSTLYGRFNQAIAKIDLSSDKITSITPAGGYAEYQWPTPSPSGEKLAYEHRTGSDQGFPVGSIDVDGVPALQYRGSMTNFFWVGNKTIALKDDCSLRIVNTQTKKIKILKLDPKGRYIVHCNGNGQLPADEEMTERESVRITSLSGLFLREEPSEKSPQIMLIPFAHTVFMNRRKRTDITVQGKTGRWTLVQYYSEGKEYEGWMFGGFLGPVQQKITVSNISDFKSGCLGQCNACGSYDFSPGGKFEHTPTCHRGEVTGKWALVGKEIRACTKSNCSPKDTKELVFRPSRDGQIVYENKGTVETVFNPDQIFHWEPPH